jgi:hypothetical protein
MLPDPNIGIYGALFQDEQIPYADQLAQMQESSFTTVVLWAFHVQPNGDLHFNDSPAVQDGKVIYDPDPTKGLNPQMPAMLQTLRGSSRVSRVLISVGGWLSPDFDQWKANPEVAGENFKALFSALAIDAVDFDYEPDPNDYTPEHQTMIVDQTLALGKLGVGVTYCPFDWRQEDWWIGCLASVYEQAGSQIVQGYNLQCYAGGAGNDPLEWAGNIKASTKPLGIDDTFAFVAPGYWVKNDHDASSCPADFESQLSGLGEKGITGAWAWYFYDLFGSENAGLCPGQDVTPKGYSEAIAAGLGR